jgi:hypothetical protein
MIVIILTLCHSVRNYSARNNLKAMEQGDLAFFYHRLVPSPLHCHSPPSNPTPPLDESVKRPFKSDAS